MAHPNDATLRIVLGRQIEEALHDKIVELIRKPNERSAGYIEALHDVQRMMNNGELPPLEFHHPSTTQERPRG